MTLTTLRPNATDVLSEGLFTGAASAHAALADDDDSSYVRSDGGNLYGEFEFDDLSLPAGSIVTKLALRLAVGMASIRGRAELFGTVTAGAETLSFGAVVTWNSVTTITLVSRSASFDPSGIDAVVLALQGDFAPGFAGTEVVVYEAYLDVTYQSTAAPSVDAPTGTVSDTDEPTVTWTPIDGMSQSQVRIFDSAIYGAGGFDPDTSPPVLESDVLDMTSWLIPDALADGDYRAYARTAFLVGTEAHWSDWAYSAFTIDVDRPAVPAIELDAESSAGRIRIEITDGADGDADTSGFEIERSDDAGETFAEVRTVEGNGFESIAAVGARAFDFEASNGELATYRVRAVHIDGANSTHSAWVSAEAGWISTDWWLKHPTDPSLSLSVPRSMIDSDPSYVRAVRQSVFQPLGRSDPIVVSDKRGPKTGTLRVLLESAADQEALAALMDSLSPILVQAPDGDNWPDRWVSIGDQTHERPVDKLSVEDAYETLPWTELAPPDGDLLAWPASAPGAPGAFQMLRDLASYWRLND